MRRCSRSTAWPAKRAPPARNWSSHSLTTPLRSGTSRARDPNRAPRWTSRGPHSAADGRGPRLARRLAALGLAAVAFAAFLPPMAVNTNHVDQPGVLASVVDFVGLSFVGVGMYAW